MASPNLLLITLFLLLCPAFTPPSTSASASSDRVALDLYYESLCPYSANFIVNHLFNIFRNGIISIVRLHLVPWGNARIRGNDTFVCQHGALECLLNTVEACAIETWPDLNKHFSVIFCIEDLVYRRMSSQWEDCFDKLGLDLSPVAECCNSGLGKELELQYAAETNALQPPHEYVPWVVVDGQPLYEDYENFMSYICKAYKGTDVPKACSEVTLTIGRAGPSLPAVCYREEEVVVVESKSILSRIK
ncbi:gamma-interferon-responsive lysosomal thiol protein [Diospyros lotus]|uniref:gamma-interferon-responsive lysosomal thiol protein n=1 Tax=Diospyros lotus TaxID=55363 RepID=UPI002255E1CC|nr:gamma-interferon-responsive lysosomal thiol protein [Diospyros lotus]